MVFEFRELLLSDIETEQTRFFELNSYRNPFRNAEYVIIPAIIALASFVLAKVLDWTCSTDFCEVLVVLRALLIRVFEVHKILT